jgi:small subunit ribosomal protein S15|tara:strand:- start:629 stop:898 length:270 start_codon:yes stop_codon:yes gene_type:complete
MPITTEEKKIIIEKFGKGEKDSGTPEVQIAILTHRIRELTDHLRKHKKDNHTRRGLVNLVSKRKKMLKYLIKRDANAYVKLIKELGIRG